MSVKVSSWVWHGEECAGLSGNELVLMLALADVAGDEGRCRYLDDDNDMTYGALAKKVRVDRRTIVRLVGRLRSLGLLSQVPGQNGRPNEFTVIVPWARATGDNLSQVSGGEPVTPVQEPVTSDAQTGDIPRADASLIRTDVPNVSSGVSGTAGERFAEPLCRVLVGLMVENGVKVPATVPKPWLDAARLLVDRDGRDPHEAKAVLEWACRDSFWRSNILSMPKFRERYDQLRLQREQKSRMSTVDRGRAAHEILLERERASAGQRAVSA